MTAPYFPAPNRRRYGSTGELVAGVDENIGNDLNYDASAALDRYARGAWGSVAEGLRNTLADTRGRSVGAGRFDSGYLDEDQGQVITGIGNQLTNQIAMQSMNAENLTQDVRGRGEEALWGRTEQSMNDDREREERKRRSKRGIFGAIGTVVGGIGGSFIPGIGTAAGAAIGGKIGGAF